MKYSMLKNFGGAYTLTSIDEESYLELQCMQLCISAAQKAQEMAAHKSQTYYGKEAMTY